MIESGRAVYDGSVTQFGVRLLAQGEPMRIVFLAGGADEFENFLTDQRASVCAHIDEVHAVAGFVDGGGNFKHVEHPIAF